MKFKGFVSLLLIPAVGACAAQSAVITAPNGYSMTTLENTKGGVFASRSNVIEKDGELIVVETNTAIHPAWSLGNTAVMGGAAVGSSYLFAKNLKPDNTTTNVNQTGGGAEAASGAIGGAGGAGGYSEGGSAVAAQQQGQDQGQQQGQAQRADGGEGGNAYARGGSSYAKGGSSYAEGGNASNTNVNANTNFNSNKAAANSRSSSAALSSSNATGGGGCFPPGHCK